MKIPRNIAVRTAVVIVMLAIAIAQHFWTRAVAQLAWKAGVENINIMENCDLPMAARMKLDDDLWRACSPFARRGFEFLECRAYLREHRSPPNLHVMDVCHDLDLGAQRK